MPSPNSSPPTTKLKNCEALSIAVISLQKGLYSLGGPTGSASVTTGCDGASRFSCLALGKGAALRDGSTPRERNTVVGARRRGVVVSLSSLKKPTNCWRDSA